MWKIGEENVEEWILECRRMERGRMWPFIRESLSFDECRIHEINMNYMNECRIHEINMIECQPYCRS